MPVYGVIRKINKVSIELEIRFTITHLEDLLRQLLTVSSSLTVAQLLVGAPLAV
jgi:hypothetical protein